MTEKFDANATPESNFALTNLELRQDLSFVLRKQERRARIAEEKLRIAVEALNWFSCGCPKQKIIKEALVKISQTG